MQSTRSGEIKQPAGTSVTALSVAMALMRSLDTGYEYLFNKQELELTRHLFYTGKRSLSGFNCALIEGVSATPYSFQQSFFNKVVTPGYDQLIMLRKLMIKNKINNAIQDGVTQIVFLGGGYDIRAFITSLNYPEINIYELDRGQTRECKLNGLMTIPKDIGFDDVLINQLSNHAARVNNNLYYIECDLTENNLSDILHFYGFSRERKSLIIAEGLSMYLSRDENQNLLNSISNILNENDELILSYLSDIESVHSPIAETAVKSSNELCRFLLSSKDVISFVEGHGFNVSGKFISTTWLEKIGDSSKSYYESNIARPRECYYSLQKSSINLNKTIDEVPSIEFEIPDKPVIEEKSDCECRLF